MALTPIGRRIAGPGFDADIQPHLLNRCHQIALDIHRQGFQGGDIEGVQALCRVADQIDQAGQKSSQGLAAARRGDQQSMRTPPIRRHHIQLMTVGLPALLLEPVDEFFW